MSGITIKNHGNPTLFLMKLKQIHVKLYRNKSKTFLASWKWSKLVDEKENWSCKKLLIS